MAEETRPVAVSFTVREARELADAAEAGKAEAYVYQVEEPIDRLRTAIEDTEKSSVA
jgi:hypothetical protein